MQRFSNLWALGNWEDVVDVIADKGYDFYEVRKIIRGCGKTPVMPRRQGAVCPGAQDKKRDKTRVFIEHFFGKIKENKRICMRFDKLDTTYLRFFCLGVP